MTEKQNEKYFEILTEKWVANFEMPDGTPNMAMCNHYETIPLMVKRIRDINGKNIVIVDKTPLFYDKED